MSKLEESIREGAQNRTEMIERLGFVPVSVLKLSRGALHKSLFHLATERSRRLGGSDSISRVDSYKSDEARQKALKRREAGLFGGITGHDAKNRKNISIMAAELVDFCLKYYSDDLESTVYLDPFAGQGVQAQVAALRGVDYYGSDLSEEYVDFGNAAVAKIGMKRKGQHVEIHRGDSRDATWIADDLGTFSFTSPPYWDVEYYSDDEGQLGLDSTYDEFLEGMAEVYRAWLPKFKDDAVVIVNVNDLRRSGEFIPYHSDIIKMMQSEGYECTDTWIVEGLLGNLPRAFAVRFNGQKIAPKVHEYLLVFKPVR